MIVHRIPFIVKKLVERFGSVHFASESMVRSSEGLILNEMAVFSVTG